MKKWKIIAIGIILTILLSLLFIFINTPKVTADENVNVAYFNETIAELKATISNLETITNDRIIVLEKQNNDLEQKIVTLNTKITTLDKELDNNNLLLSGRVNKIEIREDGLYKLLSKGYYNAGIGYNMIKFKIEQ